MSAGIPIIGGGNKFELFKQLFDVGDTRDSFLFHTHSRASTKEIEVETYINGITAADNKGDAWYVSGELRGINLPDWLGEMFYYRANHGMFYGVYDARTRKGRLIPGVNMLVSHLR